VVWFGILFDCYLVVSLGFLSACYLVVGFGGPGGGGERKVFMGLYAGRQGSEGPNVLTDISCNKVSIR